jgi:hypothetical protein
MSPSAAARPLAPIAWPRLLGADASMYATASLSSFPYHLPNGHQRPRGPRTRFAPAATSSGGPDRLGTRRRVELDRQPEDLEAVSQKNLPRFGPRASSGLGQRSHRQGTVHEGHDSDTS